MFEKQGSSKSVPHDYLLAGERESARLQLQATAWEGEADALLDAIGVSRGWSCIDLGCGPAGILAQLRKRTGQEGRVVGVDSDPQFVANAREHLRLGGTDDVTVMQGNVECLDLPPGSFDLVHARCVFPHVMSVPAALNQMIALAKPGAYVASQEPYNAPWRFMPEFPAWNRLLELCEQTIATRGDINIGRGTYHLFRQAGLEDVTVRPAMLSLVNRHPYMKMLPTAARNLQDKMLSERLTTPGELEHLLTEVERAAEDPESLQISFVMMQVWGKKPCLSD